jgi:fructoselysine-6-P-deglycase FrlB-like protein
LWQEARAIPSALERTLGEARGFDDVAALITADGVRRVVATGNGAALYVAHALWLASLEEESGFELVAVPAGVLASGGFEWRAGDRLLVVSSSGELRDALEALEQGAPRPYAAVTADERSAIGAGAEAAALVHVQEQETHTHTQAYCGNLAAAMAVWARAAGDDVLLETLSAAPSVLETLIAEAEAWAPGAADEVGAPSAAVAFGSGLAWAAALEAALLLGEVAGVPAHGLENPRGRHDRCVRARPGQPRALAADGRRRNACRRRGDVSSDRRRRPATAGRRTASVEALRARNLPQRAGARDRARPSRRPRRRPSCLG